MGDFSIMLRCSCKFFLFTRFKFANFYCLDNPGALHPALSKYFEIELGDKFEYYYNMLYSLVILPNIILPFLGGILLMKCGLRLMFAILIVIIMTGQFIFALGCSKKNIILMLIGIIKILLNRKICLWIRIRHNIDN